MRAFVPLAVLVCTSFLSAQTGTFTVYGNGCGSSTGSACLSANTTGSFSGNAGASANFALPVNTGATVRVICGVELYCQLRTSATANMKFWIYSATSTNKPGSIVRTAIMPVTSKLKWNRVSFAPLIQLPNTTFFIVFDNRVSLRLPIMQTGTKNIHFWSGPPTWRGPFTSVAWNYKVLCCGGSKVPMISNTGVPTINNSFFVDLSNAGANANAFFSIGLGRTNIDLSIIGAAGCKLYTNPLILLTKTTSATGTASMKIAVPNDSRLLNALFDTQWAVAAPGANPAGILFTSGGEGKVGR